MSTKGAFDLIVIGSGPAGEKAAAQAAYFGKQVALVEMGRPGGVCVHTGTLPSKSLRESSLFLSGLRVRGIAGLLREDHGPIPVQSLLAHKDRVCEEEEARVVENMARHNVDMIQGRGEIIDANTVRVHGKDGERTIRGEIIFVATGTFPFRPDLYPFDGVTVYDSDDILSLDHVPPTLIVIGAGVIGCEYASMFAALGVSVHLVEPRDQLLPFVDRDVVETLTNRFRELGMQIHLGAKAKEVRPGVEVILESGESLHADKLLYAAGRAGNTKGLGLEHVGVELNRRGQITVNENYQTSCPSIYAGGDVIGFPALASTSMDQGRVAMCHAFSFEYKTHLARILPYGIYTIPELSMVGLTEQEAEEKGEDYEIGCASLAENARGRINGGEDGLLKLIFRRGDKSLLGVHIVAEHAAELIHIGMTAMQFGGTIETFIDAVYNYPTLSEAYKYAAYDGLGRLARGETRA